MSREIERKFLVAEAPDWLRECDATRIEQGYLAVSEQAEVRLRRAGGDRVLTVKRGRGEVREEIEFELDEEHFEALWPLTESRRLEKTRRIVPLDGGLSVEVDLYEGDLDGLVVAEGEFESETRSREFEPPDWMGEEVTGDDRYANRTLANRGLLCGGPGNGKQKSMSPNKVRSYRLKSGESPTRGVRRIAIGRVAKAREGLAGARGDDLQEAIHDARKDLKKLRALLRLVQPELGRKLHRAENQRYRDAARLLAGSRDAEAKVETLVRLRERFEEEMPEEPYRRWHEQLERERDEIVESGSEELGARIDEVLAELDAGLVEISEWPLEADAWKLVGPGLVESYRRGRREMRRTLTHPSAENVHEWRKRSKDLWYQLRILRNAWPAMLGEMADQAHELADRLGDHHDLVVLRDDLRGREAPEGRNELEALIAIRQEELLFGEAFGIGERVFVEKPKAFGARLQAYWAAWRD